MRRKDSMRSFSIIAGIVCATIFLLPSILTAKKSADTIYFYSIYGWGKYTDSQFQSMFQDTFAEIARDLGKKSEFQLFENKEDFYKAIRKPGWRILQVGKREELVTAITKYQFRPIISYTFKGITNNRSCLYVRKDSPYKSIEDLKGATISMADSTFDYILLRKLVKDRPEAFFGELSANGDADSPAYAFYLKRKDALFTTLQQIEFLKMNNPGVIKGIRELVCSHDYGSLPILASPEVPQKLVPGMIDMINGIAKGEKLRHFQLFALFMKGQAVTTGFDDYKWTIDVYTKAVEDGWVDDFYNRNAPGKKSAK